MSLVVTTSWDDGHPEDMRLAELMSRHGIAGTFFVPTRNAEGRPTLSGQALKQLSAGFEIGGHTQDHLTMPSLPAHALSAQIRDNKAWLEQATGHAVTGFCYVRGRYNREVTAAVASAGFAYARTTENLRRDPGANPYALPTTIQFFPHGRLIYLKNLLRRPTVSRASSFMEVVRQPDLKARLLGLFGRRAAATSVFHLWGHSWEIDEHGLWGELEDFFRHIAESTPPEQRLTNAEVVARYVA